MEQSLASSELHSPQHSKLRRLHLAAVAFLVLILLVELVVPALRQSATFDEGCHTMAGYSYWTRGEFGINPEHPPLVKLLAAVPLLPMSLHFSLAPAMNFKAACFLGGRQFLYSNSADTILFRARMAVAALTVLAALLVFAAGWEMFAPEVGLLALLLFVFEPNLIAHGSLVTTDMGITVFFLATVYAFYRYLRRPSLWRIILTGIAAGLALASKHSGVLLWPTLVALAFTQIVFDGGGSQLSFGGQRSTLKNIQRLTAALTIVSVIALVVLWACYGFHFSMRPQGSPSSPTLAQYAAAIGDSDKGRVLMLIARYHLLPEAYLFGVADMFVTPRQFWSFVLGKIYPGGRWFYFPLAFIIKSTLGVLILLLLVPIAALRRADCLRQLLFLIIPAGVYFAAAMKSDFNIGIRHILPVYPFLLILAAFAAWTLGRSRKVWCWVVSALVLFHVASSVRAFPDYIPYSNEVWGGSANTYKVLADSNVDWGQQLKVTQKFMDEHGIRDCWFAYSARLVADPAYYGILCKPLTQRIGPVLEDIPARISGTVLISAGELSPAAWGPGDLNPYAQFRDLRPDAELADGVLVFHGNFDVPLLASMGRAQAAERFLASSISASGKTPSEEQAVQALAEAQSAVALAPADVTAEAVLGDVYSALRRPVEAKAAYQRALDLAQTHYPEFQSDWVAALQGKLR